MYGDPYSHSGHHETDLHNILTLCLQVGLLGVQHNAFLPRLAAQSLAQIAETLPFACGTIVKDGGVEALIVNLDALAAGDDDGSYNVTLGVAKQSLYVRQIFVFVSLMVRIDAASVKLCQTSIQ